MLSKGVTIFLVCWSLMASQCVADLRPPHEHAVAAARYLVSTSTYGIVATCGKISNKELQGAVPFSNVASFSDGKGSNFKDSTGELYFFLTKLDPTAQDLEVCPGASFTLSERMSSSSENKENVPCEHIDPENPLCRRITISGDIHVVEDEDEVAKGKSFLFSKHPHMESWPADHGFTVYKMQIKRIYLLDFFGGAKIIPVKDYLEFTPSTGLLRGSNENQLATPL